MQSFYINADAMRNDRPAVMAATEMYFADVTTIESGLLNMYDEIMPKIAHALRDQ
jgi:hypothetical protein